MLRRGMTLLEVLLALALLAGVALACFSWSGFAARVVAERGGQAAWRRGAEGALGYVGDLLAAEWDPGGRERDRWRVAVGRDRLTVRGAGVVVGTSGGAVRCDSVVLSVIDGTLFAGYRDRAGAALGRRPLLGRVSGLGVAVDETGADRVGVVVTIHGPLGEAAERTWVLAGEEVR